MIIRSKIPFEVAINNLGMGQTSQGLKFVKEKKKEKDVNIYIALEQAESFDATAVYFRFFDDGRPPRSQVYIYDNPEFDSDLKNDAEIHHRLWNAGIVPYCFIYRASRILVYNCGLIPDWKQDSSQFTTAAHDILDFLNEVQDKIQQYHSRQFDSGLFWDSQASKNFKYDQSAYEQLLTQLKNAKSNIISQVGTENSGLVKRILMMLILLKYLEERKDEEGNGALNPDEFYKAYNPINSSLEGVLENPELFINMLNDLSSREHFNGQIFEISNEESSQLKTIPLDVFKHFVRGDAIIFSSGKHGLGQMSLWKLYQFNYLPIELISHIYEDFLADENGKKKKGVVYTPPYLVQFLIDRSMPLNTPQEQFKVLDPACGSGIFLVGAFKRMIQWWRIRNDWAKPTKENINELKDLLRENIFGCDLEEEAVRLTYFSLGLALLDALSPKEIWKNVHFENLIDSNLYSGDFFKTIRDKKLTVDFDLIIGNPPFEEKFTADAIARNFSAKNSDDSRPEIPRNQIALLFFEQSINLLKQGGNCCMILPSGPILYNSKVHDYRKYLLGTYYFKAIYDFTPLRTKLFIGSSSKAKPAVLAVFVQRNKPIKNPIQHLIFRRTKASSEKIEFEIDHYDIHWVPHNMALSNSGIWQANFMGGGRLHQIVDKISGKNTLREFLKENQKNRNWVYGEGWQEAPNSEPIRKLEKLLSINYKSETEKSELNELIKKHTAEWITGKKMMQTNGEITICDKNYFQWPRKETLFQPPHLLVKESVTGDIIPVHFFNEFITHKQKIFGINAPIDDVNILLLLEQFLKKPENIPVMWLLSGQILTSREGVPLMKDILALPYPELKFDLIENILLDDILHFYSHFRKQGENSEVLNTANEKDLIAFGKIYCKILNSIYDNFKPLPPILGNEFIAYPFVLGDKPEVNIPPTLDSIEEKLTKLIDHKVSYNLWVKRIIRVYDKNVIIMYKPNQKRYWLRSIAIRDADETIIDLYNQGK